MCVLRLRRATRLVRFFRYYQDSRADAWGPCDSQYLVHGWNARHPLTRLSTWPIETTILNLTLAESGIQQPLLRAWWAHHGQRRPRPNY